MAKTTLERHTSGQPSTTVADRYRARQAPQPSFAMASICWCTAAPRRGDQGHTRELRSIFAGHRSSQVCIHPSRINDNNDNNGFRGIAFFWHSDVDTWHVENGVQAMRMVSCPISLTPNAEDNGPTGSATCLGCDVMHGYNANITPQQRPNFIAERKHFTPDTAGPSSKTTASKPVLHPTQHAQPPKEHPCNNSTSISSAASPAASSRP